MLKLLIVLACLLAIAYADITNGGRYSLRFAPSGPADSESSATFGIRADDKGTSLLSAPSIRGRHPGDVFEFRAVPATLGTWEIAHRPSGLYVHPKNDNASPDSFLWLRKDSYHWVVIPVGPDLYKIGTPAGGYQWSLKNFKDTSKIAPVTLQPNEIFPPATIRQVITIANA